MKTTPMTYEEWRLRRVAPWGLSEFTETIIGQMFVTLDVLFVENAKLKLAAESHEETLKLMVEAQRSTAEALKEAETLGCRCNRKEVSQDA